MAFFLMNERASQHNRSTKYRKKRWSNPWCTCNLVFSFFNYSFRINASHALSFGVIRVTHSKFRTHHCQPVQQQVLNDRTIKWRATHADMHRSVDRFTDANFNQLNKFHFKSFIMRATNLLEGVFDIGGVYAVMILDTFTSPALCVGLLQMQIKWDETEKLYLLARIMHIWLMAAGSQCTSHA